jgi:hypothetical protein
MGRDSAGAADTDHDEKVLVSAVGCGPAAFFGHGNGGVRRTQ